jgi:hypothetical protein
MRASAKLGQVSASCIMALLAKRELPRSRERLANLLHPQRRASLARQGALTGFKRDRRDYHRPCPVHTSGTHLRRVLPIVNRLNLVLPGIATVARSGTICVSTAVGRAPR